MRILSESRIVLSPRLMASRTFRPYREVPRSPGVHVQAINKKLGVAAGKLGNSDNEDFPFERFSDSVYPLMPALGVAWEEFRASHYSESELLYQPGELERDGIFGTHDGLLINCDPTRIWECKQTTKKLQSITTLWMYLKQGLAYCAMSGLRQVQYDICFLLGDYTRPYTPEGTVTIVEFNDMEVEQWWTIMLKSAGQVQPERAKAA